MIPLVLAVSAVLLQQPSAPQRPAPSTASRAAANADTRQAINEVGSAVAEMRSSHEALRRAAFNQTDAVVIQWAQELRKDCQDLAAAARSAGPRVCRGCFPPGTQRAMNGYRASLPSVTQVGNRCSAQLGQYLASRTAAPVIRRNIWAVSRLVVEGLFPYEARLREVREALGADDPHAPIGAPR